MAWLAKRLPVRGVPKQRHVAAMRLDMIDDRRGRGAAEVSTMDAKWIGAEVRAPRLLPAGAVAPPGSIWPGIILRLVARTTALDDQRSAPWIGARSKRCGRHWWRQEEIWSQCCDHSIHTLFAFFRFIKFILRSIASNGREPFDGRK